MHRIALPILLVLAFAGRLARADGDPPTPTAAELLAQMKGTDFDAAEKAAERLVRTPNDDFVPAALAQLKEETNFHARIALGYVLAAHGEKAGLEVLVDSLQRTGHLGYVHLTGVSGQNFGWNRDGSSLPAWRAWLATFTAEEYREKARRERLSPAVRHGGRKEYEAAVRALCDGADRAAVAAQFRAFAQAFPLADAVPTALELAQRLEEQAKQDAAWHDPGPSATLSEEARAARVVHRLRDARGVELPFDGYTSVVARPKAASPAGDPVVELLAGGAKSIPLLLGLLEDRSPIRAAGRGDWDSVPIVLRVQDAALEVLNLLLPTPTYERAHTATYLSAEEPEDRKRTIADVRSWAEQTGGKSADEIRWAGLRRAGTREALEGLRRLATDPKRRDEVLAELRKMFEGGRHWIHQPAVCELMAELGDTSKVEAVLQALDAGKYSDSMMEVEGDSSAALQAEATARRIKEKYGASARAAGPK
jgi:hypothetical protein